MARQLDDIGYSYDVLDNLTRVRQYTMGDRSTYQERSFVYDSLSRLRSETHPESGTASYQYDANGNLKRRTDARGIATTYSYDSLDRLKTTDYTDGTPTTTVTYDQGANGKGRPATASGGSGADAFHYHYDGYDGMGRVLNLRTTLGSRQFDAVYCYNFVGGITQVDYPDTHPSPGFVWEYEYDDQGRQQEMRSTSSGQTETLIDGYRKIYGRSTSTATTLYAINGTQETITYNNRMQPTRRSVALTATPTTKLMDLRYSFRDPTSSGNNGNVYRMTDRAQSTTDGKQYYSYDYLQRLTEVRLGSRTSSNKIAYGYDRWGNRTSSATKGTVANFMACSTDCAVDATTNRISDWRYDAAGNPIGISSSTLQWDGAGRLESIDSGATASYSYDHLGRRILKRAPSDNTQYFYDVTGKVSWEFDPDGTGDHQKMVRAYFNGRLFTSTGDAAAGSHTVYTDHLGTPRLKLHVTTAASQARDDYYPFGQQVNTVVDAAHDRRFTGKERDAESGLDYFGARYYHSTAGRFLSVDPVLDSADPTNPQSWNRYTYTFNNPLKYVDPDGREVRVANEMALGLILAGIPFDLQRHITAQDGILSVASVTTNDNFRTLAELVRNEIGLKVELAPFAWPAPEGEFYYESIEFLRTLGIEQKSPNLFLGHFQPGSGLSAKIIVSDRTGRASTVPLIELAATIAEELKHAYLYIKGLPYEHPDVDELMAAVRQRTRMTFEQNRRRAENERAHEARIPFR